MINVAKIYDMYFSHTKINLFLIRFTHWPYKALFYSLCIYAFRRVAPCCVCNEDNNEADEA